MHQRQRQTYTRSHIFPIESNGLPIYPTTALGDSGSQLPENLSSNVGCLCSRRREESKPKNDRRDNFFTLPRPWRRFSACFRRVRTKLIVRCNDCATTCRSLLVNRTIADTMRPMTIPPPPSPIFIHNANSHIVKPTARRSRPSEFGRPQSFRLAFSRSHSRYCFVLPWAVSPWLRAHPRSFRNETARPRRNKVQRDAADHHHRQPTRCLCRLGQL